MTLVRTVRTYLVAQLIITYYQYCFKFNVQKSKVLATTLDGRPALSLSYFLPHMFITYIFKLMILDSINMRFFI